MGRSVNLSPLLFPGPAGPAGRSAAPPALATSTSPSRLCRRPIPAARGLLRAGRPTTALEVTPGATPSSAPASRPTSRTASRWRRPADGLAAFRVAQPPGGPAFAEALLAHVGAARFALAAALATFEAVRRAHRLAGLRISPPALPGGRPLGPDGAVAAGEPHLERLTTPRAARQSRQLEQLAAAGRRATVPLRPDAIAQATGAEPAPRRGLSDPLDNPFRRGRSGTATRRRLHPSGSDREPRRRRPGSLVDDPPRAPDAVHPLPSIRQSRYAIAEDEKTTRVWLIMGRSVNLSPCFSRALAAGEPAAPRGRDTLDVTLAFAAERQRPDDEGPFRRRGHLDVLFIGDRPAAEQALLNPEIGAPSLCHCD